MVNEEGWAITMINEILETDNAQQYQKTKKKVSVFLVYLLLVIVAFICAGPFLWLLSTSFKSGQNIYEMSFFVKNPTLVNYIGVITFMSFPLYFFNTVIITVGGILLDVILAALCAYPLACMDFWGKKFIFGALMSTMILPAAAGMIVNYLTIKDLALMNNLFGVILPSAVAVFSIILMRQAYLGVPKELIDAAEIDGATQLRTWYQIILPQTLPAVSTLVIFDFIAFWNSFLWPIIILQDPSKYPLAAALKYLNGEFNYKFGYIAAGTVLSIIPVIIIFLAFQKYFINTAAGALKG
jgi:putative chitobiose transport system permease protein